MISRLKGILITREPDGIEVETGGGVVYEVEVPLTVFERLPGVDKPIEIRTLQVVREDSTTLYGFMEAHERTLFKRLMGASGVGAKLALAMLSTYNAPRLARALVEKDITALTQVSGVGKKTAERLALELSDKVTDLAVAADTGGPITKGSGAQEAVAALVALGYTFADADAAVRSVLESGAVSGADELIRKALQQKG